MRNKRVFLIYALFAMALMMLGCSEVEYDDLVEYPIVDKAAQAGNLIGLRESAGWSIYAMYFLDKDTGRIKSKIRKDLFGNRWYYYQCDSVGDYKVMSDIDPFILLADYELGKEFRSFTFGGDTIRLHDCGYYPKDKSDNSLIVVTRKEGELNSLTK